MIKECLYCKQQFIADGECKSRDRKYCSHDCYKKSINTSISIICKFCNKSFSVRGKYKNRVFCSVKCSSKYKEMIGDTIGVKCANCENIVKRFSYRRKKSKLVFCSRSCATKYAQNIAVDRQNYFSLIDTPQKAYVLGLIASDGCVHGKNKITLGMNDLDAIKFVANEFGYNNKISIIDHEDVNHNRSYTITITSDKMHADLQNLNIVERKSKIDNLDIPPIIDELERFFWAGIIDGDGSVSIRNKKYGNYLRMSVVSASEIYIRKLSEFLLKNNITSSVAKYRNIWSISFGGKKTAKKIYDLFYSGEFGMERKRWKLKNYVENI